MLTAQRLRQFAVKPHYIRPSNAVKLIVCPASGVMRMDDLDDMLGGKAAQLGSHVHTAIAAFHKSPGDAATQYVAGMEELLAKVSNFPESEPEEAKKIFDHYTGDPRNQVRIPADRVEMKVSIELPPHRIDPTGQPIYIKGTLDQIRDTPQGLAIYDVKTGKPDGYSKIHEYSMQQALYYLAAKSMGYDIKNVFLIMTGYYRTRGVILPSPDKVFWCIPLDDGYCEDIVSRLRLQVALIRSGEIDITPGSQCVFCEFGPMDRCRPRLYSELGMVTP